MLFRDLLLYRLPADWSLPATALEDTLGRKPLKPCGGFDMKTRGWVHCGYEERYLYTQGNEHLFAFGLEQKLLPASIVNQEAKDRAAKLAEQQGHPVGRRQMRELKARVTDELRSRALSRRQSTHAWLSPAQKLLAINSSTPTRAEELIETLREGLGSLPVQPVATRNAPAAAMATWLTHGEAPGRFTIDQDLELTAIGGGATVRYVRHPLDGREIKAHLVAGKVPTRLGLVWNDRIAFILHQDLRIKRVQFLDVYEDDHAQGENPNEQFDIDFALMTGELSQLLDELLEVLGGEEAPGTQGGSGTTTVAERMPAAATG